MDNFPSILPDPGPCLQDLEVILGHLCRHWGRAQAYHAAVEGLPVAPEVVGAACTGYAEGRGRAACSRLGDTLSMEGRPG